jgi:outer membrane usher protein
VTSQNRPIGRSNARGLVVVPNLVPNEPNRIAVDPTQLPIDAQVARTERTVTPLPRSGVSVDLGVTSGAKMLALTLVDASGVPLGAGFSGHNETTGEDFVVGYDGAVYLENAAAENALTVTVGEGSCRAVVASATGGTSATRATCE